VIRMMRSGRTVACSGAWAMETDASFNERTTVYSCAEAWAIQPDAFCNARVVCTGRSAPDSSEASTMRREHSINPTQEAIARRARRRGRPHGDGVRIDRVVRERHPARRECFAFFLGAGRVFAGDMTRSLPGWDARARQKVLGFLLRLCRSGRKPIDRVADDIDRGEDGLDRLVDDIDCVEDGIDRVANDIDCVEDGIDRVANDIDCVEDGIDGVANDIDCVEGDIDCVEGDIDRVAGDIDRAVDDIDWVADDFDDDRLVIDIETSDTGKTRGLPIRGATTSRTGQRSAPTITFDSAVASFTGDHVFHGNHPAWRTDRNDPQSVMKARNP
jgi:hypothetical protein